ncbi:uncharacterized protein LOC121106946 isoform X1 [Gallus gallus]|uniref:uncharacterized protein LOC121106946 isoform X1 n=1 Tax=Gallus gallus TaxID=9031 RepID=UPI001AEAEA6F|nr:uncharacterized protein LOC121106946 isoform X1 [Gallus gallus]
MQSARARHRDSRRSGEPFSEAVYEEIEYSPMREKKMRFSFSDIPVLPGDSPVEGYDDAREVSDPGEHPVPGQGDWQVPRAQEDREGPRDAARGENLHSWRSAGVPEVNGDTSPLSLGSTGYDDADEMSLS